MKKIIISALIIFLGIILFVIIYPVNKNNNYSKSLINDVYKNTDIKDISYLNKEDNYYIVKSNDKVIILDNNYDVINSYDVSSLKNSDLNLVYKRNNLYYEEVINSKDKIVYNYYDVYSYDLVYSSNVGGV